MIDLSHLRATARRELDAKRARADAAQVVMNDPATDPHAHDRARVIRNHAALNAAYLAAQLEALEQGE